MFAIALAVFLLSGQDSSSQRSASDLTRDLNSGPPVRPTPSGQAAPAQPVAPVSAPAQASAEPGGTPAVSTAVREGSAVTRDLNSAPPSAFRPSASASAPVLPAPAPAAPVSAVPSGVTAPRAQPLSVPATSETARPAAQPAPAPARAASSPSSSALAAPARPAMEPQGLDAASIAALPFTLELPSDVAVTQSRAGADAQIYAVRRGQKPLVMIYAGPASQFPIFDGQLVQAGGRASVVVSEGGRRLALEHLFRRSAAPEEIHVWVAAPDGADRDLGERIAQSVDAR